ncbi:MAG TPA: DUF4383 domain-containing protein [Rhizomicrobium sp.]|jgi:hypothetical protein|nr:DUF4383 domain-containing protein [Rhizomicrobium sp.]
MVTTAKNAAMVLGLVFLIIGVLGFVPNPIVSPTGVFVVNRVHNCVHVGSGVLLLLGAYASAGTFGPSLALKLVGIVYAILAVLGFITHDGMVFGVIAMNMADNWLHLILAAVLLYAGFGLAPQPGTAVA